MTYVVIGAAGLVVGGVLVLLFLQLVYKQYGPSEDAPPEEGPDAPPVIEPKPPKNVRNNKFRVILYTESGARARQLFEKLEPAPEPHFAERVELLHFEDQRGLKP